MARAKHALIYGVAAGCLSTLGVNPLVGLTECSASCACYCSSSYATCTSFCATGAGARCQNGFCDGPDRQCCCYVVSLIPPRFAEKCQTVNCGTAPPEQCAGSEGLPPPIASQASSRVVCSDELRAKQEDRWYYHTYRVDANGNSHSDVPFASDASLLRALQACAEQGWYPHTRPRSAEGVSVQEESLEYIPSVATQDVKGRRLGWLTLPEYSGLSGDLAIRIEVTREGEVLRKELLFSTDAKLGQLVLADLDQGLEITNPGEGPGPFTDILSLTIENGTLLAFIQSHYMAKPQQ